MASLFELTGQLQTIDWLLSQNEDAETGEILESTRETLEKDIETKIEPICSYMSHCDGRIEYLKSEVARIQKQIKSAQNKKDFLKDLVKNHMISTNKQNAEYGSYALSIAKTPAKVVLMDDAERWLPDNLCTITRTASKTAVKEAMVDGKLVVNVDGNEIEIAHLETSEALRIK